MQPKPDFFGPQHAARFQDQSVVDRYHLRPTCPPETFRILVQVVGRMIWGKPLGANR